MTAPMSTTPVAPSSATYALPESLPRGLEGLRALARACRNPLPEGFTWNFWLFRRRAHDNTTSCGCALGLGSTIWPDDFSDHLEHHFATRSEGSIELARVAQYFEISYCDTIALFTVTRYTPPPPDTPLEMAERLDEFLAQRGFPTSLEP